MNATDEKTTNIELLRSMSAEEIADAIIHSDFIRMCCEDTVECAGNCVKCLSNFLNKKIIE